MIRTLHNNLGFIRNSWIGTFNDFFTVPGIVMAAVSDEGDSLSKGNSSVLRFCYGFYPKLRIASGVKTPTSVTSTFGARSVLA